MSDVDLAGFHVRRFRSRDDERVRELNELAMSGTPEYVPFAPDEDLQDVERHYLDDEGEFLVGTVDETVVATGAYAPPDGWKAEYVDLDDATAGVTRMRVDPEWQGQGIGTAVYRGLERRARSDGYRRLVLDTGVDNDVARGFYEARGFECRRGVTVDFAVVTIDLAL